MAGSWTSQNKALPGAYINFATNAPLLITPGDRGIVLLLQEMSVGTVANMYTVTVDDQSAIPSGATSADKLLVNEALKGAKTVIIYNLGTNHTAGVLNTALAALKVIDFNVLCYPFPAATFATNQATIKTWIDTMRTDEGRKIQAVMADFLGDNEAIINVAHAVKLSNGTTLTNAQATAWVAGITAGSKVNQSNTGRIYPGAVDVSPRMIKSDMETAVTAGKFIFKVDKAQNVSAVYDINSLTTISPTKGAPFKKNRVVRTIDGINNDIVNIFESNYVGKLDNTKDGRALLRGTLIEYFNELQRMSAIQNFDASDVTVVAGSSTDAVVVTCNVQPVDSIEKIYISVNLS